jgi:hypothetical protein
MQDSNSRLATWWFQSRKQVDKSGAMVRLPCAPSDLVTLEGKKPAVQCSTITLVLKIKDEARLWIQVGCHRLRSLVALAGFNV